MAQYPRTHTLEGGFIEVYRKLPAHYRSLTWRRYAAIVRTDGNAGVLTVCPNGLTVWSIGSWFDHLVHIREVVGSSPSPPTQHYHQVPYWSPRIAIRGLPCYLR
jgi:hypothetical protein